MKRILSVAAATTLAITGMAIAPPSASADISCTGTLTGRYADNVYVPSGRTCTLDGAYIDGNVKVGPSASVTVSSNSTITGNLQAEEASPRSVIVNGGAVDGDIQVKYATGTVKIAAQTHVGGNIQVVESRSPIEITRAVVNGDVQVFKNSIGPIAISSNLISGNLQCKENNPVPTGSGNQVRGDAEDQCRNLTGSSGGGGTTPVDIYITPGKHHVNGRTWTTTCVKYSSVVDRCRTTIVATQITYRNGRFVKSTGEVFNNLTYKASPRSQWSTNPLGGYGKYEGAESWTAADGRAWRTECDTAATGRGGCRNYVKADVIQERNGRYVWARGEWVFNSMVRFSN